ncbi:beta galactofuranosyl glycosyltransferase [Trypanosoma cruzi]|nr:beta galactofuranosyl glycosyltransferase [Trypanosoma cruzi]
MEGFVGALEPFCADGRPRTLSMRGHCAGRNLFFYTLTRSHSCAPSFSFLLFFCFLSGDAPLALPPTGYARSYTQFKKPRPRPISERMLYLSSHIKFVVHFDIFFFWSGAPTWRRSHVWFGADPTRADYIHCVGERLLVDPTTRRLGEIITGRSLSR